MSLFGVTPANTAAALLGASLLAACGRAPPPTIESARRQARTTARRPFASLQTPAAPGSGEPHLSIGPAGVILSWIEPSGDKSALKYARLDGDRWGAPATVAEGDDWYVNAADVPAVEAISAEIWAAHWRTVAADDPYAYDVAIAVSKNAGATWSAPRRLNDDAVPATRLRKPFRCGAATSARYG